MSNTIRSNFQGKERLSLVNQGKVAIPDKLIISSVHSTLYDGITTPAEVGAVSIITIYGTPRSNATAPVVLVSAQPFNLPNTTENAGKPMVTVINIPKQSVKVLEIWWEITDYGYLEDIESIHLALSGDSIITCGMVNS